MDKENREFPRSGADIADHDEALSKCRQQIDDLDRQIIKLLNDRALLAEQVAYSKTALGFVLQNSQRQAEVLANVTRNNHGPLGNETLRKIFELITNEMLRHEEILIGAKG